MIKYVFDDTKYRKLREKWGKELQKEVDTVVDILVAHWIIYEDK